MSLFHYFPGARLSATELMAASLDGDLTAVGEGFIPADAPETEWMRAHSLSPVLGSRLAAVHATAAWIYGARSQPPNPIDVQRATARRIHSVQNPRLAYRDLRLDPEDSVMIAGVFVSSVVRTVVDLARSTGAKDCAALAESFPDAVPAALRWFDEHQRYPGAKRARTLLVELQRRTPATGAGARLRTA